VAWVKPFTWIKILVFAASLIPAARLVVGLFTGGLGANPVEHITHTTGTFALIFLMITLSVTPLRRITGYGPLIRLRRMLGLFAFFYTVLHLSTFVVLDHFFDFVSIIEDVTDRRFVTAGFTGFVLMIPLALTSTQAMVRRLGGRRWQALHRLVYASACAGVVHYLWLVKADLRPPLLYAAVLALLLGYRLWHSWRASAARGA
jgi:sulfoxide reductase heme-binding subunit YedZ